MAARIAPKSPIAALPRKIQTLVYLYIHVDLAFFLRLALEGF
jgi:hypothetical protein